MSHTNFITNQRELLSKIMTDYMGITENIDILVGYFYFSGFGGIYKGLVDKKVRILVGMDIETKINNKVHEIEIDKNNQSNLQKKEQYFASLINGINETESFDNSDTTESWRVFITKIQNGTLEVRKTFEPNHSKVYLFNLDQASQSIHRTDGIVITGSSNLTYSGLEGRLEANVILNDQRSFEDANKFFEELWATSVPLISSNNYDEFQKKVIDKVWIDNMANPFAMYLRVLKEYFGIKKNDKIATAGLITGDEFSDLTYQSDAVYKALEVIENHNGVIIADVVGLGKSVISSVIANNLNLKTIVIAPPHLREQWEEYGDKFHFNPRIYSSGNIKLALEKECLNSNFGNKQKLIIIDEAHKYRNEETTDYIALHQLCQNNKVMLLTATPFNNSPADIYSLVKLFQIPGKSTIKTVENLAYRFESLINKFKKIRDKKCKLSEQEKTSEINSISRELKLMIEPLIIRRSRLDLMEINEYKQDLESKGVAFAVVADPELIEYELGDLYAKYVHTLELLCPPEIEGNKQSKKGFLGAKYKPTNYLINISKYQKDFEAKFGSDFNLAKQSQDNLAKFMKTLMVKRFESSIAAFGATLNNMIRYHRNTLGWYNDLGLVAIYKKGNLPTAEEIMTDTSQELDKDNFFEPTEQEIKQGNLSKIKDLETIESKYLRVDFPQDVQHDLDILLSIQDMWFPSNQNQRSGQHTNQNTDPSDPKFDNVLNQIKGTLRSEPNRKIVIFSEFADTVDYLHTKFQKAGIRILKYTSRIADKKLKQDVKLNFDAGVKKEHQKDDYDVIVATDAISEGYNLHRAGMIINYDIPFNPTRVIQRVGRINRINKKEFEKLFILNFFPSLVGKKEYRVEGLATLKMSMIHALLGEDTKVLKSEETDSLKRFLVDDFNKVKEKSEELSWDTKYQNLIREHRDINSQEYRTAIGLPKKSRVARKYHRLDSIASEDIENLFTTNKGILVFAKRGKDYLFKLRLSTGVVKTLTAENGIFLFECMLEEQGYMVSPEFDQLYQEIKSQLHTNKVSIKQDKGEQEVLTNLRYLQQKFPSEVYLKDLVKVIQELRGLPDGVLKNIKKLDLKNPELALANIKTLIPESYLNQIISSSNQHDEHETIIFAQELL